MGKRKIVIFGAAGLVVAAAILLVQFIKPDIYGQGPTDIPSSRPIETTAQRSMPTEKWVGSYEVALPGGGSPDAGFDTDRPLKRYYNEKTTKLFAQNDYGAIYPYIGEILKGESEWEWNMDMIRYGICDKSGRIICDPVFENVYAIKKNGKELYVFTKLYDDIRTITVTNSSGSRVLEYENIQYISMESTDTEILCVMKDGKYGAINMDCIEIIAPKYDEWLYFNEGFAAVSVDDNRYAYIDSTEKTVLGPYKKSIGYYADEYTFWGGMAIFVEEGKYGYIDTNGNIIINPRYDMATRFNKNFAIVCEGNEYSVLTKSGETIYGPVAKNIYSLGEAMIQVIDDGGYSHVDFSDRFPMTDSYPQYENGVVSIKLNGRRFEFEDAYNIEVINRERLLINNNDESWALYSVTDERFISERRPGYAYVQDGKIMAMNGDYHDIYDMQGEKLITAKRYFGNFGGYMLLEDKRYAGLWNEDGFLFKIHASQYLPD